LSFVCCAAPYNRRGEGGRCPTRKGGALPLSLSRRHARVGSLYACDASASPSLRSTYDTHTHTPRVASFFRALHKLTTPIPPHTTRHSLSQVACDAGPPGAAAAAAAGGWRAREATAAAAACPCCGTTPTTRRGSRSRRYDPSFSSAREIGPPGFDTRHSTRSHVYSFRRACVAGVPLESFVADARSTCVADRTHHGEVRPHSLL
jgi:hypothetical protein